MKTKIYHFELTPDLIRLSIGLEHAGDLTDALDEAFALV